MSDDRFMKSLRAEPRPEFAQSLGRRLASIRNDERAQARRRPGLFPGLAVGAFALAVLSLVIFPSVRASAQAFLDLFRVRTFQAISFDPERLESLRSMEKDLSLFLIEGQKTEPRRLDVPDRATAEAAAGIPVLEPGYLPTGLVRDSIQTVQHDPLRLAVSSEKLRSVVDALDLRDVDTPEGLEGKWIDVRFHPVALQHWAGQRYHVELAQARSPEVSLPAGLDLEELGRIGLRILGLDAREADRLARSIDWHSTLLVPVPANASSIREVPIRGARALLVTTAGTDGPNGHRRREGSVLLWTEGDRVFALSGNVEASEITEMAESLR